MNRNHTARALPGTILGYTRSGKPIPLVRGGAEVTLEQFLAMTAEERTAHLATLDDAQQAELAAALEEHVATVTADEASTVEQLNAAADARDSIAADTTVREELAATAAAERAAALARLQPAAEAVEETPEEEAPAEPVAETTEEAPAAEAPAEVQEPVAASAPAPAPAATPIAAVTASARTASTTPRPRRTAPTTRGSIVASADLNRISAGATITREQLAEGMTDKVNAQLRSGQIAEGAERVSLVASLVADYPEERTLGDDPAVNTRRMDAVARAAEQPGALTASGGLCAPTAVDYSLLNLNSDERPVQAGLPQLRMTRGGIRYIPPRRLSDITSGVDQWTVANDANPSSPATKSRLVLACQTAVEVLEYAVTERIQFGNLNARAFPEQVAQDLSTLGAAHARKAERLLLGAIKAAGTAVTAAKLLGATRDLLATVDFSIAYLRDRHRMSDSTRLTLTLPRHVREMMRADLTRQMADGSGSDSGLGVTDAQIAQWFSVRNADVIWALETTATASGIAFAAQTAGAALGFPDTVEWDIFPTGSFQYLDGGEIALGAVRDSTLNGTNDYEMFGESFEAVAFRGVESLHFTSTVQPDGSSAGLVNTTGAALSAAVNV